MTIRCRTVFGLTLILLSWTHLSVAQQPHLVSDIHRIIAQQKLVVALIDTDYPPLFVTGKTSHLKGSAIALVRDIARELGVRVEFVRKTHSFNDIIDIVSRGEADIGLATSITLPRAKKVRFTRPYMTLRIALLLNRLKLIEHGLTSELKALVDLRHTTQPIGILTGSAYAAYARKHFPKATLREYASLTKLLEAVQRGDLLAAVRNDLTATRYLRQRPEAVLRLQLFVDQNSVDYLAFPVRWDQSHLLAWLNTYLLIKDTHWNATDLLKPDP